MNTPHLDPLARAAVALAGAASFSVWAEAPDGERRRIGPAGAPGRDLVIVLEPPARPVVAELLPVEPGRLAA